MTTVAGPPGRSPSAAGTVIGFPNSSTSTAPSAARWTVPSTKFARPMKSATKRVAGRRYTSSGVPDCSTRPAFITTTTSDRAMASAWSWVT
jgi:hypothetical protein